MQNPKKKTRLPALGATYVFCSKKMPAVASPFEGKYLVGFLALDDPSRYGHANAVSLAQYFAGCHGRIFDSFNSGGTEFAQALGYKVEDRVDQPAIDSPQDLLKLLPSSAR